MTTARQATRRTTRPVLRLHRVYDSVGNLADAVYCDAEGDLIESEDVPTDPDAVDCFFEWTGRPRDELTGIQNNRGRWYDPETNEWLSLDPSSFAAGDANLYRYCGNDPVNHVDPTGLVRDDDLAFKAEERLEILRRERLRLKRAERQRYQARKTTWNPLVQLTLKLPMQIPNGQNYDGRNSNPNIKTADDALRYISRNMLKIKRTLVNQLDIMVQNSNFTIPLLDGENVIVVKVTLGRKERERIVNLIADQYIRTVVNGLIEHPLATPSHGARHWLREIHVQNEFSRTNTSFTTYPEGYKLNPVCADWAAWVREGMNESAFVESKVTVTLSDGREMKVELYKILKFKHVQFSGENAARTWGQLAQHNWVAVHPSDHYTKDVTKDPAILYFDVWLFLLPDAYTTKAHPSRQHNYPADRGLPGQPGTK